MPFPSRSVFFTNAVRAFMLSLVPSAVLSAHVVVPHLSALDAKRLAMCGGVGRRACDDVARSQFHRRWVGDVRRELAHYAHTLVVLMAPTLRYFYVNVEMVLRSDAGGGGERIAIYDFERPFTLAGVDAGVRRLDVAGRDGGVIRAWRVLDGEWRDRADDDDGDDGDAPRVRRQPSDKDSAESMISVATNADPLIEVLASFINVRTDVDAATLLARYIHSNREDAARRLRMAYVAAIVDGSYEDGSYELIESLCAPDRDHASGFIDDVAGAWRVGRDLEYVAEVCARCGLPPLTWIDDLVRRALLLPVADPSDGECKPYLARARD